MVYGDDLMRWLIFAPPVIFGAMLLTSHFVAWWKRRRDARSYRRFLEQQSREREGRLHRNELFRDYVRTNHFKPYDASNG